MRLDLLIETDPDASDAELAKLTTDLRSELLTLDIESAQRTTAGLAPSNTRAGELFVAGALTVILAHSSELFTALIARVESWIRPHGGRSVEIVHNGNKLKLTGVTRKTQQELTEFFKKCVERDSDR